jgi:hypothetical protein
MRGKNEKIKVGAVGRLNTQNSTVYSRRDFSFPPQPTALLVNNNLYQYIIIDASVYSKVSRYPRLKAYIRGASGKRKKNTNSAVVQIVLYIARRQMSNNLFKFSR